MIDLIKLKFTGDKPDILEDVQINDDGTFCKFDGDDNSNWIGWRVNDQGPTPDDEMWVYLTNVIDNRGE